MCEGRIFSAVSTDPSTRLNPALEGRYRIPGSLERPFLISRGTAHEERGGARDVAMLINAFEGLENGRLGSRG